MVLPRQTITQSAEGTQRLGAKLGRSLLKSGRGTPRVICLYGELGSGKTTFVQGLAKGLGIMSRLLSPTFIIVRRYRIPKHFEYLYHLDLYRIKGPEDALAVGFSDMLAATDSLVVIEWPERLGGLLPEKRIGIQFLVLPNGDHEIRATSRGY